MNTFLYDFEDYTYLQIIWFMFSRNTTLCFVQIIKKKLKKGLNYLVKPSAKEAFAQENGQEEIVIPAIQVFLDSLEAFAHKAGVMD